MQDAGGEEAEKAKDKTKELQAELQELTCIFKLQVAI